METVRSFVQRTRGPVVKFLPDRYPWGYAADYLRVEAGTLPGEVTPPPVHSLNARTTEEMLQRWCRRTGEQPHAAAVLLADAYLERWGIEPLSTAAVASPHFHQPPAQDITQRPAPPAVLPEHPVPSIGTPIATPPEHPAPGSDVAPTTLPERKPSPAAGTPGPPDKPAPTPKSAATG